MSVVLWASKKSWFSQYGWTITGVLAAILFIAFIVMIVLLIKSNKEEKKQKANLEIEAFLYSFGGKDNIVSMEAKESRLVVVLKDYSRLNEENLKTLGVTSLIKATTKVTLILGEKAKTVAAAFNSK